MARITNPEVSALATVTAEKTGEKGRTVTAEFSLFRVGVVMQRTTSIAGRPFDGQYKLFTPVETSEMRASDATGSEEHARRFLEHLVTSHGWTVIR
jgi:hypothetical protein